MQKDTEQEVDDVTRKRLPREEHQRSTARAGGTGAAADGNGASGAAPDDEVAVAADRAPVSGEPVANAAGAAAAGKPKASDPPADEEPVEPDQRVDAGAGSADKEPDGRTAAEQSQTIEADLAGVRAEAVGYLNDLRRLQAEFDNYRKRMLREQTARMASASQALVSRLLPVLDNFELAISHAEQSRDFDRSMLKGVEMVFGELQEVLRGEGLSRIEAEGKPFDPERHEAVVAVEEEGAEPGTVVDVVRTGYELQGKVLRPAMVKVAR
ncbi:MAG TPA: nucleotide exchange factor GrpE [Actinomycetes bacterium]|nr:nucleotide exchange factor GrpE [Actinomycetes bacterium]